MTPEIAIELLQDWLKIPASELARVLRTTGHRAMIALDDLERAGLLERFGGDEYRLTCFYCNRTGKAPAIDLFWRGNRNA
jgi:DNA-binding IclR family transcriptional regulator